MMKVGNVYIALFANTQSQLLAVGIHFLSLRLFTYMALR